MKCRDYELAEEISRLMWHCDGKTIPERCQKLVKVGHEPRFLLGVSQTKVAEIMRDLVLGGECAKKWLFAVPETTRKALCGKKMELKRRLADSTRGMKARYIYSSMLAENGGGQGYIVFRCSRSNKCIVYMLEWSEG